MATGQKESERTRQMKAHFMEYHEKGYSIPEVAEVFSLSASTVYSSLHEIAEKAGVTRESLLQEVHKTPSYWMRESDKLKISGSVVSKQLDELISGLDDTIENVNCTIKEMEEFEYDEH